MSMNAIPEIFIKDFQHIKKIDFFRKVIYIFLFFNTISLLPIAQEIWSYTGIIGSRGFSWAIPYAFINALSHPLNAEWTWVYKVFIGGQLLFLLLGVFNVLPRISSIAVYFFTANLFLKGALLFTGGEVLMNLLLIYLIFVHPIDKASRFYFIQNWLNNVFYYILLIQVCVLYFFSCFYKLFDENWLSGEAITYISRIPHFSSATYRWFFEDNGFLSVFFTYLTLVYQGLFAFLVWVKRIKIPFLIIGVLFHFAIAIFMGIFTFAIIMIISYILFLEEKHIEQLKSFSFKKRGKA